MSVEGTSLYCGDNCNHTGPHRYRPTTYVSREVPVVPPITVVIFEPLRRDPSVADPTDHAPHEGEPE